MGKKNKGEKKSKSAKKKPEQTFGAGDLASVMVQAARSMRTVLSRNLVESGLYAGQDGVILALAETDGMTAGGLAARLGVKAPTMTRTIGRLEVQGFVERRPDADDARLTKVYLTETGRRSLVVIAAAGEACEKQAIEGLSDKELRTLVKLLKLVDRNLQKTPRPPVAGPV